MMKTAFLSRLPAVALVAVLSAYPLASQAAVLKAGAFVEVGVVDRGLISLRGLNDVIDNPPASETSTTGFDISTGRVYTGDRPDFADATASANQNGWMYSAASGINTFKSVSHVQQSLVITNNTGADQNYNFDFTILHGELGSFVNLNHTFSGPEFAAAGNLVRISLDGVELFGSSALLINDDTGMHFQTSGEVLGSYTSGDLHYQWDEYSDTLNLGILAPGSSFTLTYDIVTAAAGMYNGEMTFALSGAHAFSKFGDPNGINKAPIGGNVYPASPTVSVPEPSLWLLMGTGLFGFAVARRRKAVQA